MIVWFLWIIWFGSNDFGSFGSNDQMIPLDHMRKLVGEKLYLTTLSPNSSICILQLFLHNKLWIIVLNKHKSSCSGAFQKGLVYNCPVITLVPTDISHVLKETPSLSCIVYPALYCWSATTQAKLQTLHAPTDQPYSWYQDT